MTDTEIWTALRRSVTAVAPHVPEDALVADVSLADLGCTSIDRADIVVMTMDDLGVDAPLGEFRQDAPLAELVNMLRCHAW